MDIKDLYTKKELIEYLLAEIDELEPKNAHYPKYYHDIVSCTLSSEIINFEITNEGYKELFIEELNKKSTEELIKFMIRNLFLYESVSDSARDISKVLSEKNRDSNTEPISNKEEEANIDKTNTADTCIIS